MQVNQLSPAEWSVLSENAHRIAFGEHKPASWDRIDYALVVEEDGVPMGYLTCREVDAKTVYWQFGGAMPGTKGTTKTMRGYQAFIRFAADRYDRVTTLIENTNTAMLKMAMSVGFRIVGVRNYKGSILLEHLLEFEHA